MEFMAQRQNEDGDEVLDSQPEPLTIDEIISYVSIAANHCLAGEKIILIAQEDDGDPPVGWPAPVSIVGPPGSDGDDAFDAELVRDTIAAALVAGTNVTITPNDGADTITVASTASASLTYYVLALHADTATNTELLWDWIAGSIAVGAALTSGASNSGQFHCAAGLWLWELELALTAATAMNGTIYAGASSGNVAFKGCNTITPVQDLSTNVGGSNGNANYRARWVFLVYLAANGDYSVRPFNSTVKANYTMFRATKLA